ncbi:MAG: lysophospholipid acyltransferase family protein [Paracoccaceae bacterium]
MAGMALAGFTRLMTAPRVEWIGTRPSRNQRIYFANHTSNGDFVLLWACLPGDLRARTRPVAARDYWEKSPLRAFVGRDVFRAVLIDRVAETRAQDPFEAMGAALSDGASLIIFPEGRRNESDAPLLELKSGIFHLAGAHPKVELIPVWINNLNKVMPRGEIVPVPLICTVSIGAPMERQEDETKEKFLDRARNALLDLAPERPAS